MQIRFFTYVHTYTSEPGKQMPTQQFLKEIPGIPWPKVYTGIKISLHALLVKVYSKKVPNIEKFVTSSLPHSELCLPTTKQVIVVLY